MFVNIFVEKTKGVFMLTSRNLPISVLFIFAFFLIFPQLGQAQSKDSALENDFTLTSLDGETYTLSQLQGKVVMVDFWATWCPPCRAEIPHLIEIYNKYKDKGFILLGVSNERPATVQRYQKQKQIPYPLLIDDGSVSRKFAVEAIPTGFIFDKEGNIHKKHTGFAPGMEKEIEADILELLEADKDE